MRRIKELALRSEAGTGIYLGFLWASLVLFLAIFCALLFVAVVQGQLWAWAPLFAIEAFFLASVFGKGSK